MLATIARPIARGGLRVVDALHLRGLVRRVVHALPPRLRRQVGLLQVRLGVMDGLVLVPQARLEERLAATLGLFDPSELGERSAYLEFGVFVGSSMASMYHATRRASADRLRLIGFDSFEGMPAGQEAATFADWHAGQLYSDIRMTRANLQRQGVPLARVTLVPGWFDDSLTAETRDSLQVDRAVVIMMDCVLESSTRTALEFCTPLIRDRAVIFFDDWGAASLADRGMGEASAFAGWLRDHPEMAASEAPELSYEKAARPFVVTRVAPPDPERPGQPEGP
jgi:hypothetical protein